MGHHASSLHDVHAQSTHIPNSDIPCIGDFWSLLIMRKFIGLSFFDRPILGDHVKAHICGFHMKSSRFHEIHLKNLINQIIQEKLFSFMESSGKAMSQDFT